MQRDRPRRTKAAARELTRAALLAVAVVLFLPGATGVIEREFKCEEAAAHLEDCCDDFDATEMNCSYGASCGEDHQAPALTIAGSECILELSCEEVLESGVCNDQFVTDRSCP